jgi:5'(3')-deoxyribonucleotidase
MFSAAIDPAQLGFDFDGVIADTAETFLRLACTEYDLCGFDKKDITNFEVEQCLDMPRQMVDDIFTRVLVDSVGTGLKPMPGAVDVLGAISETAEVTVVTARPFARPVHDWLEHVFPQPVLKKIKVVAMGAHDDKSRHIHNLKLRYFIDDRAETCVQLDHDGINSIVFSQPWNENRHQLPVVDCWEDIRELCIRK